MAVFRNEPEEWQRLDWAILQNGYACLYHRQEFLQLDVMWFRKERYRVIEFDCARWETDQLMHDDLKQKLRFLEYYGSNFNALNDCLRDIDITGKGTVLLLHHFDAVDK